MDLVVTITLMLFTGISAEGDSDIQIQEPFGYSGQGSSFFLMQHLFKLEGKIETQLNQMEEDVEELKSKGINWPQECSSMREDITEMKSDIDQILDINSVLKQELTVLQDGISELQKAVSRIQSPVTTSLCPRSWIPFGESCYKIYTEKKTWESARLKCRDEGGYLVEIDDEAEGKFIKKEAMYTQDSIWLGGSDRVREGHWQWATSKKKISDDSFTDWTPGNPSNRNGNEHCLIIYKGGRYGWNDVWCANKYGYVCEMQIGLE